LMWSLNSQRGTRTSGPKNFQSSAKKDFFNTIGAKRTFSRAHKPAIMSDERRIFLAIHPTVRLAGLL
jgi:hypothetical protein